jgi:hypothetical protein
MPELSRRTLPVGAALRGGKLSLTTPTDQAAVPAQSWPMVITCPAPAREDP